MNIFGRMWNIRKNNFNSTMPFHIWARNQSHNIQKNTQNEINNIFEENSTLINEINSLLNNLDQRTIKEHKKIIRFLRRQTKRLWKQNIRWIRRRDKRPVRHVKKFYNSPRFVKRKEKLLRKLEKLKIAQQWEQQNTPPTPQQWETPPQQTPPTPQQWQQ